MWKSGLVLAGLTLAGLAEDKCVSRVGIVGAGVAGSSIAYFLSQNSGLDGLCVDVYDKDPGVANASHVSFNGQGVVVDADRFSFLKSHRLVGSLARAFKLDTSEHRLRSAGGSKHQFRKVRAQSRYGLAEESVFDHLLQELEAVQGDPGSGGIRQSEVGIWSGKEFVFRYQTSATIPPMVRQIRDMVKRYGIKQPIKTFRAMRDVYRAYSKVYARVADRDRPFSSLQDLVDELEIGHLCRTKLHDYLSAEGNSTFVEEVVDPIIRSKYGQSSKEVSAFAGLFGLVNSRFMNVYLLTKTGFQDTYLRDPLLYFEGGPDALIRKMVEISQKSGPSSPMVKYYWQEKVASVVGEWTMDDATKFKIVTDKTSAGRIYDYVVIATPLNIVPNLYYTRIRGASDSAHVEFPYRPVFASIVQGGKIQLDSSSPQRSVPGNLLFTASAGDPLLSVSMVSPTSDGQYLYRLYSTRRPEPSDLKCLFGSPSSFKILHCSENGAYPRFSPISSCNPLAKIETGKNIFVPHSIESLVSSLETKLVSSHNVAKAIVKRISTRTSLAGDELRLMSQFIQNIVYNTQA